MQIFPFYNIYLLAYLQITKTLHRSLKELEIAMSPMRERKLIFFLKKKTLLMTSAIPGGENNVRMS